MVFISCWIDKKILYLVFVDLINVDLEGLIEIILFI